MEQIKRMIAEGKVKEAISRLTELIEGGAVPLDECFYLRGNAYRKLGQTRLALNDYLEAIALNPDSPAATAYRMQIRILDFYNRDMYNQ